MKKFYTHFLAFFLAVTTATAVNAMNWVDWKTSQTERDAQDQAKFQQIMALKVHGPLVFKEEGTEKNALHVLAELWGGCFMGDPQAKYPGIEAKIIDIIETAPQLMLTPDQYGRLPFDDGLHKLFSAPIYESLARKIDSNTFKQEELLEKVAPAVLRGILVEWSRSSSFLDSGGSSQSPPPAEDSFFQFVSNCPMLLNVKPAGSSLPLYLNKIPKGKVRQVHPMVEHYFTNAKRLFEDADLQYQLFLMVNNEYDGLYAVINGSGNFDSFKTKLTGNSSVYAGSSHLGFRDVFKQRLMPVFCEALAENGNQMLGYGVPGHISIDQLNELFTLVPELRVEAISNLRSFGTFEQVFTEEEQQNRLFRILSNPDPNIGRGGIYMLYPNSGRLVNPAIAGLVEQYGSVHGFTDFFKVNLGNPTRVEPELYDQLYRNPLFNQLPDDSAVRAFMIGWNIDVSALEGEVDIGSLELRVWEPAGMTALFQHDDALHSHDGRRFVPQVNSAALRSVCLMTEVTNYAEKTENRLPDVGHYGSTSVMQNQNLKILAGRSDFGISKRPATKEEFLLILEMLKENVTQKDTRMLELYPHRKTLQDWDLHHSMMHRDYRSAYERTHAENMYLCALAMKAEVDGIVDDVAKVREISSQSGKLEADVKKSLYTLEDTFGAKGRLIKNRVPVDTEFPDEPEWGGSYGSSSFGQDMAYDSGERGGVAVMKPVATSAGGVTLSDGDEW